VAELVEALRGAERGKDPALTDVMLRDLGGAWSRQALRRLLARTSDYPAKLPDTDCEAKFESVDWENDKILIYIGRLIAAKGVQSALCAFPSILAREPRARLLVVGHGPLREVLECMVRALESGDRELLAKLASWGTCLEDGTEAEPLVQVQHYLERLERAGELEDYLQAAAEARIGERVIFTGYLTHRQLRHLLPCCDVAMFPSVVAKSGPLVFLEALAAGVHPMGTYFGGMAASIDSTAGFVPDDVRDLMKLRREPEHTVADIVASTCRVLELTRKHAADLRRAAVEGCDWAAVARKLIETFGGLAPPTV